MKLHRLLLPLCALSFSIQVYAADELRVNGVLIPTARIEAAMKAALATGAADTPPLRIAVRTQLTTQEVLRQAALKKGFDKDPAVIALRDDTMIRRYLAETVRPAPIPDAEIQQRYAGIIASLGEKEFKFSLIAVDSADKARAILDRLAKGANFADLARTQSQLPSAAQGGALDWISFKLPAVEGKTAGLPLAVAQAIASLPPGGVSAEPLVLDSRFYLLRMDDVRPTRTPTYAEAAPMLRQVLDAQARERASGELVARLLKEARVSH